jgi:hypothetical protein
MRWMVVREGTQVAGVGLAVGRAAAFGLTRLMVALLGGGLIAADPGFQLQLALARRPDDRLDGINYLLWKEPFQGPPSR